MYKRRNKGQEEVIRGDKLSGCKVGVYKRGEIDKRGYKRSEGAMGVSVPGDKRRQVATGVGV